jgi:signal peptidase I
MISIPDEKIFFYHGFSMRGTFRLGDCMFVEPIMLNDLHPGDIVIYQRTENNGPNREKVVHRVIKIVPGGLISRGDNNQTNDKNVVLEEDLVGRVTGLERGGKYYAVRGGKVGRLRSAFLRWWNPARRRALLFMGKHIYPLGRWFYRWLRERQLAAYVWKPSVTQIYLHTKRGPVVKYSVGTRTVAYWYPNRDQFRCKKPYDLVIPRPSSDPTGSGEALGDKPISVDH